MRVVWVARELAADEEGCATEQSVFAYMGKLVLLALKYLYQMPHVL